MGAPRGGPGDSGAACGPVATGTAGSGAPGRRKALFLSSPRPPRPAHTSSLTHFAAQAVIWRQRRRPRLPGARCVLDAASPPGDRALLRYGRWDICVGGRGGAARGPVRLGLGRDGRRARVPGNKIDSELPSSDLLLR